MQGPPSKRIKLEDEEDVYISVLSPRIDVQVKAEEFQEEDGDIDHCSICLQPIADRTVIPACSHEFCFECLLVWTEQSRRCPLCAGQIGEYLIHNIRSNYDYQKHYLTPLRTSPRPAPPLARMPGSSRRRTGRRELQWGRTERRAREAADELDRAIERRRWVYRNHLYAKHVASNSYTHYRPFPTPSQFAANTDLIARATVFVRRELHVWDSLDVEFLTTFTVSLMKSLDIRSEPAVKLLAEFLDMGTESDGEHPRANAEHFAHELYSYLRSPFRDLAVYDSVVQYDAPSDVVPPRVVERSRRWHADERSRSRSRSRSRNEVRSPSPGPSRTHAKSTGYSHARRSRSRHRSTRSPSRADPSVRRARSPYDDWPWDRKRGPGAEVYRTRSGSRKRDPDDDRVASSREVKGKGKGKAAWGDSSGQSTRRGPSMDGDIPGAPDLLGTQNREARADAGRKSLMRQDKDNAHANEDDDARRSSSPVEKHQPGVAVGDEGLEMQNKKMAGGHEVETAPTTCAAEEKRRERPKIKRDAWQSVHARLEGSRGTRGPNASIGPPREEFTIKGAATKLSSASTTITPCETIPSPAASTPATSVTLTGTPALTAETPTKRDMERAPKLIAQEIMARTRAKLARLKAEGNAGSLEGSNSKANGDGSGKRSRPEKANWTLQRPTEHVLVDGDEFANASEGDDVHSRISLVSGVATESAASPPTGTQQQRGQGGHTPAQQSVSAAALRVKLLRRLEDEKRMQEEVQPEGAGGPPRTSAHDGIHAHTFPNGDGRPIPAVNATVDHASSFPLDPDRSRARSPPSYHRDAETLEDQLRAQAQLRVKLAAAKRQAEQALPKDIATDITAREAELRARLKRSQ